MTGPNPAIDPAFAAALNRFDVPAASAGFGDRIVGAALTAAPPARVGWRLRDRHRPWTRRALAGGVAFALCTTAVAAALLDRAGIRLPAIPALLTSAPPVTPTAKIAKTPVVRAPKAAPRPTAPVATQPDPMVEPPMQIAAAPLPQTRREAIRERLRSLPPAERRAIVRTVIARAAEARAATGRVAIDGERRRAFLSPDRPRLADRPARRAALIERIKIAREQRELTAIGAPDVGANARPVSLQPLETPATLAPLDGSADTTNSIAGIANNGDRAERIRQLRQMRALRQQLRRQRRQ